MAEGSLGGVGETRKRLWLVNFLSRLVKEEPLGAVGLIITLLLLFTGVFADFLAPYGMNETWVGDDLAPPSSSFLLGTDNVGRDVLSRVIFGARVSVIIGLSASTLATILNLIIGIASGYLGGRFDLIMQRFVDAFMCLPSLVVLLVVMSFVGGGMLSLIIVLGLLWGITASRVIRSAVIGIKENAYVKAAKAAGCSTARILIRHILPNTMAPAIILFSIRVPTVIMTEASLSFLGFGIPPPDPSWGGMISGAGRTFMYEAPGLIFWPGLALAVVVYGTNMFGDAVRDLLDPRLRGGAGRYGAKTESKAKSAGGSGAPADLTGQQNALDNRRSLEHKEGSAPIPEERRDK